MLRIAALVLSLTVPLPANATPELEPNAVVYCHDIKRNLVQRVRVRHCSGEIVSPEQASVLHARIEADRRARRQRSLQRDLSRQTQGLVFHSAGTAFAVNRAGDVLTSAHVIKGCHVLEARRGDGSRRYRARVKAVESEHDLAVIRLESASPSAFLKFSPASSDDGEPLALIGYPSEGLIRVQPRLTPVLISYAISHPKRRGFLGVAGDVRRGNSGGPALDSKGRVTGVLKAKVNSVVAHRLTGRALKNLGVVVDVSRVLRFLQRTGTPYAVDGPAGAEMSGRDLFAHARKSVYRIDCLKRRR